MRLFNYIIFCQCFCFIYDSVVLINEIIPPAANTQTVMLHLPHCHATPARFNPVRLSMCNGIYYKISGYLISAHLLKLMPEI